MDPLMMCAVCQANIPRGDSSCPFCGGVEFEEDVREIARDIGSRRRQEGPFDLDEHGQPYAAGANVARRRTRDVAELLGLAKGMLADGVVNEAEAHYLKDWAANHPDAMVQWPVSLIFTRVQQMFSDGQIDPEERTELKDLLAKLIGGEESVVLGYDAPTKLPLDEPTPLICWVEETYVFTGRFAYGTRKQCEREVIERGGSVEDGVTRRTSFLVIGTFSSRDWVNTSYGRKIQRAAELRDSGFALRIVGEDHWAQALATGV